VTRSTHSARRRSAAPRGSRSAPTSSPNVRPRMSRPASRARVSGSLLPVQRIDRAVCPGRRSSRIADRRA
jgi:hypothetical protein